MTRCTCGYVQKVLDAFEEPRETPDGWSTTCPAVGHGDDGKDSSPSLRVTVGVGGKVLVVCRVGCSADDVLAAVGLTWRDLFPADGELPQDPICDEPVPPSEEELAHRAAVYADLLSGLTLAHADRRKLRDRGFTPQEIAHRGYRTLHGHDQRTQGARLREKYGHWPLLAVPGFTAGGTADHVFVVGGTEGTLVPVRDLKGRVVGVKVRKDSGRSKYIALSSTPDGPAATAEVHVPLGRDARDLTTVRLTEGEIKADLATALAPLFTLGVPGAANWRKVLPVLAHLAPRRVLVSYDWPDLPVKRPVARQAYELFRACQAAGYEAGIETWDDHPDCKGIDDLLAAGHAPAEVWGAPAITLLARHAGEDLPDLETSAGYAAEHWQPPDFPLAVFPPVIRTFVEQTALRMKCPPDFTAVSVLSAASRAIGTTRVIELEAGWKEWAVLYAAVIGPPGTLKTPAMKRAIKPLSDRQLSASLAYEAAHRAYGAYLTRLKAYKEGQEDVKPDRVKPPAPLENLYAQDFTTESLVDMLYDNGSLVRRDSSVLLYCDELMQWLNNLNAYRGGKGADRQMFLSFWSCEQYKKNRKMGKETVTIATPFVTVLGGIQPDLLPRLQDDKGNEDGFIHRILFAFPRPTAPYAPDEDTPCPPVEPAPAPATDPVTADYRLAIDVLWEGLPGGTKGPPPTLYFTPGGWAAWVAAGRAHALDTEAQPTTYHSPWSKFRAYAARLVMILHFLRVACGEAGEATEETRTEVVPATATAPETTKVHHVRYRVDLDGQADEQDVANATALVHYFKEHYKVVLHAVRGYGPEERRIEEFVTWCRGLPGRRCRLADVSRPRLHGCKGKADALRLFRLAEDRGYGKAAQAPPDGLTGKGKPTTWFACHDTPAPQQENT